MGRLRILSIHGLIGRASSHLFTEAVCPAWSQYPPGTDGAGDHSGEAGGDGGLEYPHCPKDRSREDQYPCHHVAAFQVRSGLQVGSVVGVVFLSPHRTML